MPAVIKMSLSNGYPSRSFIPANKSNPANKSISVNKSNPANKSNLATVPNAPPSALNSPMVTRIFNVKAGCGSCGRH